MVSAHALFVTRWKIPPLVESLVTTRRSFAKLTLAPAGNPDTSKRRNACFALVLPPTAEKVLDEPKALPELA